MKNNESDVLSSILNFFSKFEQSLDQDQKVFSLHLASIHFILSSVLKERVATTPTEILEAFYEEINELEASSFGQSAG